MREQAINVHDLIDQRPVGWRQIGLVLLCALVMFVDGLENQAISYAVPRIALEWHLDRSTLGPIFSSALLSAVLGYCSVSQLSAYLGHRRMLLMLVAVFALSSAATALAQNVPELIAARFVTGLALGAAIPSAIALACEYCPTRRRSTGVLMLYCGYSLGFVAAGVAALSIMPAYGWRALFWVGAVLPAVLAALLFFALPESLDFMGQNQGASARLTGLLQRMFPNDPSLADVRYTTLPVLRPYTATLALFKGPIKFGTALLWLTVALNNAEFYFLQNWLPTLLNTLHYSQSSVVWITISTTLAGALSAFVIGPAMDRFGAPKILVAIYLCGACFVGGIAATLSLSAEFVLAAAFCAGFCVSGGLKSAAALAATYYPTALRASGVGWALGMGRFGGALAPIVVGAMYANQWHPANIFLISVVPMVVAAMTVTAMSRLDSGVPPSV
jgi:AAHS family 4-hydroxybenzoate transporter-like MFS transporter